MLESYIRTRQGEVDAREDGGGVVESVPRGDGTGYHVRLGILVVTQIRFSSSGQNFSLMLDRVVIQRFLLYAYLCNRLRMRQNSEVSA